MVSRREVLAFLEEEGLQRSSGIRAVRGRRGPDIFADINHALEKVGSDGAVFVEPKEYTRANNDAVRTQLVTKAEGQTVKCWGADFDQADGANLDSMVDVQHDSFTMEKAVLRGNRANNPNTTSCLSSTADIKDLELVDIEPAEAPRGLDLQNMEDGSISKIDSNTDEDDVDVAMRIENCQNMGLNDSNFTGFTRSGVELIDCGDITINSTVITTDPDGQPAADQGLLVRGTVESRFFLSVESNGDITDAVKVEPFDPGGSNEVIPVGNLYDVKAEGPAERGMRLSDADAEIVRLNVLGNFEGGRTTEAFLVDSPDGIEDSPGHQILVNSQGTERFSNTQIDSTNAGMQVSGHIQKLQSTSSFQNAGTGVLNVTFGPSTPNPAINILADTSVETEVQAIRETTDGSGQVPLDWGDKYAFDNKPTLSVLLEQAGSWHVANWDTDANGRFTGADIEGTNPDGSTFGAGNLVIARLQGT